MLKSRIPRIVIELELIGGEIEQEGAETVEASATQRVSVRSGDLRDAIHTDKQADGTYVVAGDEDDVFYGHMVENGTSHSPPHPFLVPALEENRDPIEHLARGLLRRL